MPTIKPQTKLAPGWKIAAKAVLNFDSPVSVEALKSWLANEVPEYNSGKNLRPDLEKVTVNGFSRGHYLMHAKPRRTDTNHEHDLLFKEHAGKSVTYEIYQPVKHGVWELFVDESASTKGKLRVRQITDGQLQDYLLVADQELTSVIPPDGEIDARKRLAQEIVVRRGQSRFRGQLLEAYDGRCAISGSSTQEVLEAANIRSYMGDYSDSVTNGLLLRADIHTLFDLGLIWVERGIVATASHLRKTEYGQFIGKQISLPRDPCQHPSSDKLDEHGAKARQAQSTR